MVHEAAHDLDTDVVTGQIDLAQPVEIATGRVEHRSSRIVAQQPW
jgi:hypothetical protein